MATLFLDPPNALADAVEMVGFFITSNLAGQDTRNGFVEVLTGQLTDLLGEPAYGPIDEASREMNLRRLLDEAAEACRQAGKQLVLLIDGVDEDRGVLLGRRAGSVVGLLPRRPPRNLRIIVAGRPNPPLPQDVPDGHPLRDPDVVRNLPVSPHAREIERRSWQELHDLLHAGRLPQDILGFITVARGLSLNDLAELTSHSRWQVEEILHTAGGRTFLRHDDPLAGGGQIYRLGHEQLEVAAVGYFGPARLESYRRRLHAWCAEYQMKGWPSGTPAFLLDGYFQLLMRTSEHARAMVLVTDPERCDRMFACVGGDGGALSEMSFLLGAMVRSEHPDLASALKITWHRDRLLARNLSIHQELPMAWLKLGNRQRALALALAMPAQERVRVLCLLGRFDEAERAAETCDEVQTKIWKLTEVAQAAGEAGQTELGRRIAQRVENLVICSLDPPDQMAEIGHLARALTGTGQAEQLLRIFDWVEQLSHDEVDPVWKAGALATLTRSAAEDGTDAALAQRFADRTELKLAEVEGFHGTDIVLGDLACGLVSAGDFAGSQRILGLIVDPVERGIGMVEVAGVSDRRGCPEEARRAFQEAERIASALTDPKARKSLMLEISGYTPTTGGIDLAKARAMSITDPVRRAFELTDVAKVATANGLEDEARYLTGSAMALFIAHMDSQNDYWLGQMALCAAEAGATESARWIAEQAERMMKDRATKSLMESPLEKVAELLGKRGHTVEVARIASMFSDPGRRAWAESGARKARGIGTVAMPMGLGQREIDTPALLRQSEEATRTLTETIRAEMRLLLPTVASNAIGAAGVIPESDKQTVALSRVAAALSEGELYGWTGLVLKLFDEPNSESIGTAWNTIELLRLVRTRASLAEALTDEDQGLARREAEAAERTASLIKAPVQHASALAEVARAMALVGRIHQAEMLADRAEEEALALVDLSRQMQVMVEIANAHAATGRTDRAYRVAVSITDPAQQASALVKVAIKAGRTEIGRRAVVSASIGGFVPMLKAALGVEPELVSQVPDIVRLPDQPESPKVIR